MATTLIKEVILSGTLVRRGKATKTFPVSALITYETGAGSTGNKAKKIELTVYNNGDKTVQK